MNVQHDCETAGCSDSGAYNIREEREYSGRQDKAWKHNHPLTERYIINMHALHNAHHLRAALPRHLTSIQPAFDNRLTKHLEQAARLRETLEGKRRTKAAQKQAKAKAAAPGIQVEEAEAVDQCDEEAFTDEDVSIDQPGSSESEDGMGQGWSETEEGMDSSGEGDHEDEQSVGPARKRKRV